MCITFSFLVWLGDIFSFRAQLHSGKLELVSTRMDGLFEAGGMPEHSTGLWQSYFTRILEQELMALAGANCHYRELQGS